MKKILGTKACLFRDNRDKILQTNGWQKKQIRINNSYLIKEISKITLLLSVECLEAGERCFENIITGRFQFFGFLLEVRL